MRIEWPSGIVQELQDVAAMQTLTVTEPIRLQAAGPGQFQFKNWKGQAFTIKASAVLTAGNSIPPRSEPRRETDTTTVIILYTGKTNESG